MDPRFVGCHAHLRSPIGKSTGGAQGNDWARLRSAQMINKEGQDNAYEREKYWIQWFKDSSNFVLPLKWKPQTAKSYPVVIEKVSLTNLQNIIK